jgi:hypothetical protein
MTGSAAFNPADNLSDDLKGIVKIRGSKREMGNIIR